MKVAIAALSLLARGSFAQSMKSCGAATDILQNPVITLSPDPPTKTDPFTMTVAGTLSKDIGTATPTFDMDVTALSIIKTHASGSAPLAISPGAPAGPFSLRVGPFTPPNVPGSLALKGQVKAVNEAGEQIMCLDIDMKVGDAKDEYPLEVPELDSSPPTSCGTSSDHMPDAQMSTDSSGKTTITGTLDEDVTTMNVAVDIKIKKFILSIPIKMNVPVSISPGIPKGAAKAAVGPVQLNLSLDPGVTVQGTTSIQDGNKEQITCVKIDTKLHEQVVV